MSNYKSTNVDNRIACFIPFIKNGRFGGAERRIPYIFSSINNKTEYKVDIVVWVPGNEDYVKKELSRYIKDGTDVYYFSNVLDIVSHFKKSKYDIVCFTDALMLAQPAIVGASLAKSKTIMLMESTRNAKLRPFRSNFLFLLKHNIRTADYVDSLYPYAIDNIHSFIKSKKVTLTPPTLTNLSKYVSGNYYKENIILFAGRLTVEKNAELLLEAISIIKEKIKEKKYVCWICGEGPYEQNLKKMSRDLKIEDVVEFKGYQHMEKITPMAKVFCSLQSSDNYPSQSLMEGIASGCYCIISDVGSSRLLEIEGITDFVDLNARAIAYSLENVLDNDEADAKRIYDIGNKYAIDNFSVEKSVSHYAKLFDSILNN